MSEFQDIIPKKETITFSEHAEIIYEIDKVWKGILKEKESENELLKEQLRVEQEYIRTELTQIKNSNKELKKDWDRMWKELQDLK